MVLFSKLTLIVSATLGSADAMRSSQGYIKSHLLGNKYSGINLAQLNSDNLVELYSEALADNS